MVNVPRIATKLTRCPDSRRGADLIGLLPGLFPGAAALTCNEPDSRRQLPSRVNTSIIAQHQDQASSLAFAVVCQYSVSHSYF